MIQCHVLIPCNIFQFKEPKGVRDFQYYRQKGILPYMVMLPLIGVGCDLVSEND